MIICQVFVVETDVKKMYNLIDYEKPLENPSFKPPIIVAE